MERLRILQLQAFDPRFRPMKVQSVVLIPQSRYAVADLRHSVQRQPVARPMSLVIDRATHPSMARQVQPVSLPYHSLSVRPCILDETRTIFLETVVDLALQVFVSELGVNLSLRLDFPKTLNDYDSQDVSSRVSREEFTFAKPAISLPSISPGYETNTINIRWIGSAMCSFIGASATSRNRGEAT